MKRISVLMLILVGILGYSQVKFSPGIRAGANFARFTQNNDNYTGGSTWYNGTTNSSGATMSVRTDAYLGFQANIRFAKVYALQPEINYSRQGTVVNYTQNNVSKTNESTVSYTGLTLMNKFYMGNFNVHFGPFLEFQVEQKNIDTEIPLDFGVSAGVGYDIIDNLGVEARVKKGIIPIITGSSGQTNLVFSAGLYYNFGQK